MTQNNCMKTTTTNTTTIENCTTATTTITTTTTIDECHIADSSEEKSVNNGQHTYYFYFLILPLLVIFIIIHYVWEGYQMYILKMRYWKDLENYIELFVLLFATNSVIFCYRIGDPNPASAFVRGFSALGICLAWLEMIFLIGRYPFRGGKFSVMYYNILKKLARYALALMSMGIGFTFAFVTLGHDHIDNENDVASFSEPFRAIVKTLTMTIGEFDFDDYYKSFRDQGKDLSSDEQWSAKINRQGLDQSQFSIPLV